MPLTRQQRRNQAERTTRARFAMLSPADEQFDTWRPRDSHRQFIPMKKHSPVSAKSVIGHGEAPHRVGKHGDDYYQYSDGSIRLRIPVRSERLAKKRARRAQTRQGVSS